MRSLKIKLKHATALLGVIAAGLLSNGCSHLTYTDPNPTAPYAFPGQGMSGAAMTPPGMITSPRTHDPLTMAPPVYRPVAAPQLNVHPELAPVGIQATPVPVPMPGATLPSSGGVTSLLTAGETVTVTFADLPPPGIPDQKLRIGDDGKITLPFNVTVQAAGKTANQLSEDIRKEYVPRYFVRVTTAVKTEDRFYYVGGEVKIPARQPYLGEMTVLRAIDTAGGFGDFADRDHIELRRQNGEKPQIIKWSKAIKDPRLDPQVFPSDQITVHKRKPFKIF